MMKFWRGFGILLGGISIVCIGICMFREGEPGWLLPAGMLCNSLALFLYCSVIRKKKSQDKIDGDDMK